MTLLPAPHGSWHRLARGGPGEATLTQTAVTRPPPLAAHAEVVVFFLCYRQYEMEVVDFIFL